MPVLIDGDLHIGNSSVAAKLGAPVEVSPKGVAVIVVIVGEDVSVPADTRALIVVTVYADSLRYAISAGTLALGLIFPLYGKTHNALHYRRLVADVIDRKWPTSFRGCPV